MIQKPKQSLASSPGASRSILALIVLLAVCLRVAVALYLGDEVPPPVHAPDDTSYSYLAERLAAGYGYSFDRPWYPFAKPGGYPTAHWSFLYTAFLTGIYTVVGPHPLAGRLVGAILGGVLLPLVLYRLAQRVFPGRSRLALCAAGSGAVYAYFVLYSARLMTESLYIVSLLWVLERAIVVAGRPSLRSAIGLGLGLGLATLLRQSVLPWALVLFAWLLWTGLQARLLWPMARALALSGAVVVGMILPITVRNYLVYDDFLLLNSNAGYAMYSAQHPMHGTHFEEHAAAPIPNSLLDQHLSEPELDRALMRLGIEEIRSDPVRYARLSLSRVRAYFVFWPTSDSTPLYNVGRMVSFTLFLPLMLYGLVLALGRAKPIRTRAEWARFSTTPTALLLLFVVFYSLLHILTWAMTRYRLPVDAVTLVFAALALDERVLPHAERWRTVTRGRTSMLGKEV